MVEYAGYKADLEGGVARKGVAGDVSGQVG